MPNLSPSDRPATCRACAYLRRDRDHPSRTYCQRLLGFREKYMSGTVALPYMPPEAAGCSDGVPKDPSARNG